MLPRRLLFGAAILSVCVGVLGVLSFIQQRVDRCAYVPLLAAELLPNATLSASNDTPGMPVGWARGAGGVQLRGPAVDGQGFDLDGDGRALQMIGIANYVQTPPMPVRGYSRYCFSGFALSDSPLDSTTRVRLVFRWADAAGNALPANTTVWQPVRLWTPATRDWSPIRASFMSPPNAASLAVRIEPASDDRIYLDAMHVRSGGADLMADFSDDHVLTHDLTVLPWPGGRKAAVAFSFDWETAMGGLIHSRSVGDPNGDQDYLQRGMRMREGITTTLAIFQPYHVRATYFATGYNFLLGNRERRSFLNNPTFEWATKANGWTSNRWTTTPWFGDDPYGTVQSNPAWYFGDLVPRLLGAGQEIQSHTFSHFFGGYVGAATWQADLQIWDEVAAERGVPPARAIAFPWSSSSGLSDSDWDTLEQAGIVAVTRLSDQAQYNLFPLDSTGLVADSRCRWVPGREDRILACPDFYLKPERADLALSQIERAIAQGGMIDIWAHTEEVTSPEQIAAWQRVVRSAAENPAVWVAPFSQIADWQRAVSQVKITSLPDHRFQVSNLGAADLVGLGLQLPTKTVIIDLGAGKSVEIQQ
ncbi:MAG: polysaccharide deacetylase [Chloroflexales bacterium]